MNNKITRLLTFFIGVPIVLTLTILPYINHLTLHLLILLVTFFAAGEVYEMISKKTKLLPKPFIITSTLLIPCVGLAYSLSIYFLDFNLNFGSEIITYLYIFLLLIYLGFEVFTTENFDDSISRLSGSIFILTYVGFLVSFISRLSVISIDDKNIATPLTCVFLLMVLMCDSLAWVFGILFGKNNRGFVKASPNKSLIGFAGGILGSIASGILGRFIWPEIFSGSIVKIIAIGVIIAMSSIIGDLSESVLKRSSGVKDSGNIIPGRGGMLDSLDSILMSAPVYYVLISIFYGYTA